MKIWFTRAITAVRAYLERKDVRLTARRYLIDAMGAMAKGLFASLLIGTVLSKLSEVAWLGWLSPMAGYASGAAGAAMAVAIGYALNAPPLVLFTLCGVGLGANAQGGPLGTLICACVAAEAGKLISGETKLDILLTPVVTLLAGLSLSALTGPGVLYVMRGFGALIRSATELTPFTMGMLVSALVGVALTLPISSAAICSALELTGLAGGAATAGCCAQMVGFAIMSYSENRAAGLAAQGLGTSMLQMGNIVKNPRIWIPPILVSIITGPIATCVFDLENAVPIASGMGTCGLVGPIGLLAAEGFGGARDITGLILVCFILPATLTPLLAWPLRKLGWIKPGDLKLNL